MNNILDLIGNTPLIQLLGFEKKYSINAELFAKIEYLNPFGSIKDRVALQIINDAEKEGRLTRPATVIEATSGNLGIALSAVSLLKGYCSHLVMPNNTSLKKLRMIESFGANITLTDVKKGMQGAIEKACEICKNTPCSYYVDQFNNYSSISAHRNSTAPEIINQMHNNIDIIITGIGSGGTISGIAEHFKEIKHPARIIGVLPSSFPHNIQGIGAGFVPQILRNDLIDEIIKIDDKDAYKCANRLSNSDALYIGPSSGAVLAAAIKLSDLQENYGKKILMIFADGGERYI